MNHLKTQYLENVRASTAYPVYRGFIGTIALIGFVLAAAFALLSVVGGVLAMSNSKALGLFALIAGELFALLVYMLARFFKEAALILADAADSIVDTNARPPQFR